MPKQPDSFAALQQALASSQQLLQQLADFDSEQQLEAVTRLVAERDQWIRQTFAQPWSEEAVQAQLQPLRQLELLDQQLNERMQVLKLSLQQQRSDNQHNRKAVNAYARSKSQFSR